MNKSLFLIIFSIISLSISCQNAEKSYFKFNPDTVDLSSYESIYARKDFLINCFDFLLNNKMKTFTSEAEMNCYKLSWKLRYDRFSNSTVKIYPKKLLRKSGKERILYFVAQSKLKLEDKDYLYNNTNLVRKSLEIYLDYCLNPKNKIRQSKELKRIQHLRESGKLEEYIQELILDSYNSVK